MKGTCSDCAFWWAGDGVCSVLRIVRPPAFSCVEHRIRREHITEGDCGSCTYYTKRDKFCRAFTIVVEPSHGCRAHAVRTKVQLNHIINKLNED